MELSKKNRNSGKSNVEGDFEVSIFSSFFKLNRLKKNIILKGNSLPTSEDPYEPPNNNGRSFKTIETGLLSTANSKIISNKLISFLIILLLKLASRINYFEENFS